MQYPPPSTEPKATDAYASYVAHQHPEKQQDQRSAELVCQRDEKREMEAAQARGEEELTERAQDRDGEQEWLSVEESREREWCWWVEGRSVEREREEGGGRRE
jgi:hypothetical protein